MPNKYDIINAVEEAVLNALQSVEGETQLSQSELTIGTDAAAVALETVNPDRTYPSTPV